jgi:hypothetical protein
MSTDAPAPFGAPLLLPELPLPPPALPLPPLAPLVLPAPAPLPELAPLLLPALAPLLLPALAPLLLPLPAPPPLLPAPAAIPLPPPEANPLPPPLAVPPLVLDPVPAFPLDVEEGGLSVLLHIISGISAKGRATSVSPFLISARYSKRRAPKRGPRGSAEFPRWILSFQLNLQSLRRQSAVR